MLGILKINNFLHYTPLHIDGQAAPTDEDLTVLIDEINKQIRRFDQRIDVVTSMYDGKTFIVMVNTIDSAIMR